MNSEVVLTPEKQIMKFPISLRSTKKIVDKSAQRKKLFEIVGLGSQHQAFCHSWPGDL